MAATKELVTIAESIGRMMATANNEKEPEVTTASNTGLLMSMAMLGSDSAYFVVGTLFGFPVQVTVSKVGR